MTGAAFNTGKSKQDYATPWEFIEAVETRFGKICFDLAAHAGNTRCGSCHYTTEDDSLTKDWWKLAGLLWLNPPFARIKPWAAKCDSESRRGARIAMLVPASVGSKWFADHVFEKTLVLFLRPRMSFDGKHSYPKDLMLLAWGYDPDVALWKWK